MREIIKFIFKVIVTPILILIALLILLVYLIFGLVAVPIMAIRYLGLTVVFAVVSAFKNEDFTNRFLDALYEFLKKYVQFFLHIFYIPLAVWIPANTNKSDLKEILDYEYEIFSKRWLTSILIFLALIFSFTLSFSILGLKGLDFLDLDIKRKIEHFVEYKNLDFNQDKLKGFEQSKIDSIQKSSEIKLSEINEYYENEIDSLNNLMATLSNTKEKDIERIDSLSNRISSLEKRKPKVEYKYVETETYHKYGKNYGRLFIHSGCERYNGAIKVWVNEEYWGELTENYATRQGCNSNIGLYRNLPVGRYKVVAKGNSTSWTTEATVYQDNCNPIYLTCDQ